MDGDFLLADSPVIAFSDRVLRSLLYGQIDGVRNIRVGGPFIHAARGNVGCARITVETVAVAVARNRAEAGT
jgi:hypothetical protein